jgi:tellurite resistance protein
VPAVAGTARLDRDGDEAPLKKEIKAMNDATEPAVIPASFFGIVLGLAGLGNAWRVAHQVWELPAIAGEAILAASAIVWAILIVLYANKWLIARAAARAELNHPVQCCFIGLIGVTTMLIAGAAIPYTRIGAEILFGIGVIYTIAFAVWRTGALWMGGRDPGATTAVLYLPAVAESFVTATVAGALGYADWGQYAFGSGLFTWFAIESVLLHRLYTAPSLPLALQPSLGIQLAPPTVGAVAYLSVTSGMPDLLVHAFLGYGLLQALLMLRLLPWILQQSFSPSYWAFSFGVTALAAAPLRMIERGDTGPAALLAPPLFIAANIIIALLAIATLKLLVRGRLVPKQVPSVL